MLAREPPVGEADAGEGKIGAKITGDKKKPKSKTPYAVVALSVC
jgi:hypothetical protein